MKKIEEYINSKSGKKIFIRSWIPKGKIKKNILVIHGLGEHSGRYKKFAEEFNKKNVGVFSFDLVGHGKSYGIKGHISKFQEFIELTENALIYVRKSYLDIPIVLFGHSLGGLIALWFLIQRESKEIDCSIISSPWIRTAVEIPKILLHIQAIFKHIFPRMRLHNRLITKHLSKNKRIVDEYEKDKLVHSNISLGLYSEIIKTIEKVIEISDKIKIDTFLYHGKDDKIISYEGTEGLSKKINNSEFILYNKVFHEPHNDLERKEVFNKIFEFIEIK